MRSADMVPGPPQYEGAVLLVSFPHQLLHALSALQYDRQLLGVQTQSPISILVWSYQATNHARTAVYRDLIKASVSDYKNVKLLLPTLFERCFYLLAYRHLRGRARWIRRHLASEQVHAVYFAHDASAERTAQALMQAFPKARRVCYGDPPGFLYPSYSAESHDSSVYGRLKRKFWNSRSSGLKTMYRQSRSIIAVDFRRDAAADLGDVDGEVRQLPRSVMLNNLARIRCGLKSKLDDNCAAWLSEISAYGRPYLLLMSNFSESGLTAFNDELQMYVDICNKYIPIGKKILIKPHFGTRSEFVSKLMARLGSFDVHLLPENLRALPIELMSELVSRCEIISVSSSSALIAHLYEVEVVHALSVDEVCRYFKASAVEYMLDANERIRAKSLCGIQKHALV